jgi:RHS repeat-associated protein
MIESLEERVLLDTDLWQNAVSGNWTDGSKWSLGAAPGVNDTAVINATGAGYTVTLDTSPTIAGLTLNSTDASFVSRGLTLTVNGPATLTAGSVLLDNSTWAGSGTLVNNAAIAIEHNSTITSAFINNGTLVVQGIDGGSGFPNDATLTVAVGFTNAGTITLAGATPFRGAAAGHLTITSGAVTNEPTGIINFAAIIANPGQSPATDSLSGDLVNEGTVTINEHTQLTKQGGTITNTGSLIIAAGVALEVPGFFCCNPMPDQIINQDDGTLTDDGTLSIARNEIFALNGGTLAGSGSVSIQVQATFNFNGGSSTVASVLLGSSPPSSQAIGNASLHIGAGSTGAASFVFEGAGNTLSGDVAAAQTLVVQGTSDPNGFPADATLTAAVGFTNAGTITLAGATPFRGAAAAHLAITSGAVTNEPTGIINFAAISANPGQSTATDSLSGDLVNEGTVTINEHTQLTKQGGMITNLGTFTIAAGVALEAVGFSCCNPMPDQILNQDDGTLTDDGTLSIARNEIFALNGGTLAGAGSVSIGDNATFNFNGGSSTVASVVLTGVLTGAALNIGAGSTGAASFVFEGGGNTLSGDVAPAQTLVVQATHDGDGFAHDATLTAAVGFNNAGTIILAGEAGGRGPAAAHLTITNGAVTNMPTGIINFAAIIGSSGQSTVADSLSGGLINDGAVNVDQNTNFSAGAANVVNAGRFRVNGVSVTINSADVANSGVIDLQGVTLNLASSISTNSGDIHLENSTLNVTGSIGSNSGVIEVVSSGLNVSGSISTDGLGAIIGNPGSTLTVKGNMVGGTRNADRFNLQPRLVLNGPGNAGAPQFLETMGQDLGPVLSGFHHNFVYSTLSLANGTYVRLVDNAQNSIGTGAEALYVDSLIVPAGTTFDLNGLHVYARAAQLDGTVVGGTIQFLGDGGPLFLNDPTPGEISPAGEVDDWTFFGRGGQTVTVVANIGSTATPTPVQPVLNNAQITLLDSNGTVLGTATNSAVGADVMLAAVALPSDGTYHVRINAPSNQVSSTGHYVLAVWDAAIRNAFLNLNQQTTGVLETPFAVDRWNFAAPANEQVQFHLLGTLQFGIQFDLVGPNGFVGFSNLTSDSGLINLPANGNYTVVAHSDAARQGGYAFRLDATMQTDLTLGMPFNGTFAGSGQVQLFRVNVPESSPLKITLQDNAPGASTELYVQHGSPPTRALYQFRASAPGTGSQQLVVPQAGPGTWYILVYTAAAQANEPFTLTAAVSPIILSSVTPGLAYESIHPTFTTFTVTGAGFDATTTVSLVDSLSGSVIGLGVQIDSPTQITASLLLALQSRFPPFDPLVPPGVYDVQVSRADGSSATLIGAFRLAEIQPPPPGQFDPAPGPAFTAHLVLPSEVALRSPATIYIEYENDGVTPIPAPLLELTPMGIHADGTMTAEALVTLDQSRLVSGIYSLAFPDGFSNSIQALASGGTPGILQPGETGRIPVYWAGWLGRDRSVFRVAFDLTTIKGDDARVVDWISLKDSLRPASVPSGAWNAVFSNLIAQVGNTWGSYVSSLDSDADYLGRLGAVVSDAGRLWQFELSQAVGFNAVGSISRATDATVLAPGLSLSFHRTFSSSLVTRYTLGPLGRGWLWTDGWLQSLAVAADGTVVISDPAGNERRFQPDRRGPTYFAEPGDHGTLAAISGGGFTLTEANGLVTGFRADGKIDFMQDTNDNRITAGYTGNLLTSLTHSQGQSLTFTYNSAGRIISLSDSTGRTTSYSYDASNQFLLSVTDAAGRITSYNYDTSGVPAMQNALLSVQNPDGTIDQFGYDSRGFLAEIQTASSMMQGPGMMRITFVHGPRGEVSVTDADNISSTFSFDDRGVVVKITDGLGNATHYAVDNNFNLTQVVDAAGQVVTGRYDQLGHVIDTTSPNGSSLAFTYSGPFNRLASSVDPNGNTTSYASDSHGNLLSITYPNGAHQQFSYDPLGNLTDSINGRSQPIHSSYNNAGQITREDFVDGTHLDYAYDSHGLLVSAADAGGATTFQYDPVTLELVQVNYPGGRSLTFTYDSAGRRVRSVDQDGFTVNYEYHMGMLAGLTDGNGNAIASYTYDAAGRLSRKDLGNGTFTTFAYDLAGNVLHLVNHAPDGSVNSRFDYTYDGLRHRTAMTTLDGRWNYQYDSDGWLTHAIFISTNPTVRNQDLQYVYDAAGNRLQTIVNGVTTAYVSNNLNQYTQIGSTRFSYDADGNLIAQSDGSATTTLAYDVFNHLTGVTSPTGTSSYRYDPLGRLSAAIHDGQISQYLIDPGGLGNIVGEYNGSGNLLAHYTYGLGLTSRVDNVGQAAYYDFEIIGSTAGLSGAAGNYVNSYRYLPFGERDGSVESLPNRFQFVGQLGVMSQGDGLDFMRARFYSRQAGRFVSPDPFGLVGSPANLYTYAAQNPLTFADPTGRFCFDPNATADIVDFLNAGAAFEAIIAGIAAALPGGVLVAAGAAVAGGILYGGATIINYVGRHNPCQPDPDPQPPQHCPASPMHVAQPFISRDAAAAGDSCPVIPLHRPSDPNLKTGPAGFGASGFLPANSVLPYRIEFENEATATAPAQRVIVTDQLDPNLDWSTFQLTDVGFGDNLIAIAFGSQHFQTSLDMTFNGETFQVEVELGINLQTGQVFAIFQSIDPATGLPPDVLTGFLPPEDGTGRGMGHFSYIIRPRASASTGTQIHNVALVTFDAEPAIATDQVDPHDPSQGVDPAKEDPNTIDSGPPTSTVLPLPATTTSTSFAVSWAGQDDAGGSGIASFDIFFSDNGGPFTTLLTDTTDTSATFTGQPGHTYAFYSIATDNVGNREATPMAAQAVTTITSGTVATSTAVTSDASAGSVFGQLVTFTATVSTVPPGAGTPTGMVQFIVDGSNFGSPVSLSGGSATLATSSLAVGTHTITASYAGDTNFNASTSANLTQTVNQAATTTTTLTSSPNPASPGQTITFTVSVTPNAPGSGAPTGMVTFMTVKTTLGTAALDSAGHATLSISNARSGSIATITATYNGDTNFQTSTGSMVQTVSGTPVSNTTTTLTSSLNPSNPAQAVTFIATVSTTKFGIPSGTVTFLDGKVSLGTSTLDSSGVATFTTSSLPTGTHLIGAFYNGSIIFNGSTANLTQTVLASATASRLTSSPAASGVALAPPEASKSSLPLPTQVDSLADILAQSMISTTQSSPGQRSAVMLLNALAAPAELDALIDKLFGEPDQDWFGHGL